MRLLGYEVTHDVFRSGIRWHLSSWTGVAEMGRSEDSPTKIGFIPEGYQYLSLQLGPAAGYFKGPFWGASNTLTRF